MSGCTKYGTVEGCGECLVDVTNFTDLRNISSLAIATIAYNLVKLTDDPAGDIDVSVATIYCNGIIKVNHRRQSKCDAVTYSLLLQNWTSAHTGDENISTRDAMLISECINTTANMQSYDRILYEANLLIYRLHTKQDIPDINRNIW